MRIFTKIISCVILIVIIALAATFLPMLAADNAFDAYIIGYKYGWFIYGLSGIIAIIGCLIINSVVNDAFKYKKPVKQTTKQNESHYVKSAPSNSTVYTDTKISKKILGKKAKNVFNGKTEAIGKVLHYSYSGKAKIVCDENEICIFDEKTNEMKTSLQFCNVAYIEISKGMGGKTSVTFVTSSGETLEVIVSKDAPIVNGIFKMKEILDNSADN